MRDKANDLAVIQTARGQPTKFRAGRGVRLADQIVVAGFPLRGLLGDGLNVTTGTVSALSGIGNDSRFLQISADVNPGNSGGPPIPYFGQDVQGEWPKAIRF